MTVPSTSGHHQRVRSSADIPSEEFRTLYEFELRLTEKLDRLRSQTKEDIATAVALGNVPLFSRFDKIDARLDRGETKFEDHEKRLDEHSDVLDKTSALYADRERMRGATTSIQKTQGGKATGGWISVDKIPGILTASGILISTVIGSIALLRNPAHAPTPQQPPAKTVAAPADTANDP